MEIHHINPSLLDFADHRASATQSDIQKLCDGVIQYGFNSAFVNPLHVSFARKHLGREAKVGTVISFPLGQDRLDVKIHGLREAITDGTDELDIVPDISLLIAEKKEDFQQELQTLTKEAKTMRKDIIVKFIIEMGLFVDEKGAEIMENGLLCVKNAALAIEASGADFVKLCSGMGPRGVCPNDVSLVRSVISPHMKVKCAGGIDTKKEIIALLEKGANRFGTSHAIAIMTENNR